MQSSSEAKNEGLTAQDCDVIVEYLNAKFNPAKDKEKYRWTSKGEGLVDGQLVENVNLKLGRDVSSAIGMPENTYIFYYKTPSYETLGIGPDAQKRKEERDIIRKFFSEKFHDKFYIHRGPGEIYIKDKALLQQLKEKALEYQKQKGVSFVKLQASTATEKKDDDKKQKNIDELSDLIKEKLFGELKKNKLDKHQIKSILLNCIGMQGNPTDAEILKHIENNFNLKIDPKIIDDNDLFNLGVALYVGKMAEGMNRTTNLMDAFADKWFQEQAHKTLREHGYNPETPGKDFFQNYATQLSLAIQENTVGRIPFFGTKNEAINLARAACPLRKTGAAYEFLHPNLQEYFACKVVYDAYPKEEADDQDLGRQPGRRYS